MAPTTSLKFIKSTAFLLSLSATSVLAGNYTETFGSVSGQGGAGTPYGNAVYYGTATVTDGEIRLTGAFENSAQGSLIVNDLDAGLAIDAFTASFTYSIGAFNRNDAADGVSFNFGAIPAGSFGESGPGGSHILTVRYQVYNGAPDPVGIYLFSNGTPLAYNSFDPYTGNIPEPRWNTEVSYSEGLFSLSITDHNLITTPIFSNVATPGFSPQAGDVFGFGGRTGGLAAEQRFDNINISTIAVPEPTATVAFLGGLGLFALRRRRSAAH